MTEAEALTLADAPDWWIGPGPDQDGMRTLRRALAEAARDGPRARLFRPGGGGKRAIWLNAEDIAALNAALNAVGEDPAEHVSAA